MGIVNISKPNLEGVAGVRFVGARGGQAFPFMVTREALEDVEYQELMDPQALMAAFLKLEEAVADAAGRALDQGMAGTPTIVIESLLI